MAHMVGPYLEQTVSHRFAPTLPQSSDLSGLVESSAPNVSGSAEGRWFSWHDSTFS